MSAWTVTAIKSLEGFDALAPAWDDLLGRSADPEIFLTPLWMRGWWEVFGGEGGRQLLVLVVHEGDRLVGLLPLVRRPVAGLGPARLDRLELLGTGEHEADEVCSDFLDVVAEAGKERAVCEALWQFLAREVAWDEMAFRNVLAGSRLGRLLPELAAGRSRSVATHPGGGRFYVELEGGSFDGYTSSLSAQRRRRIFYYRRRLEREGGLEERRAEGPEQIRGFLAETARLNRLRRDSQGKPSAFASAKFRQFHKLMAPRLAERGWLDLRVWLKQGQVVAALYAFVYARIIYYYQSGWDTAAFGNISPGLVTLSRMIEEGFAQRLRRFDFMVGGDGSYKEDYECRSDPVCELRLTNNTWAGQLVRGARGVRRLLREVASRAQPMSR